MAKYGIDSTELARLLEGSMKPEEINGDPAVQHERVREILHWFARPPEFAGNPKWLRGHAMELAYYVATGGKLSEIDIKAIRDASFRQGFTATDAERAMLMRIGYLERQP